MPNSTQPHIDLPLGLITSATKPKAQGRPAFEFEPPSYTPMTPTRHDSSLSANFANPSSHYTSPHHSLPTASPSFVSQPTRLPSVSNDAYSEGSGRIPHASDISTSTGKRGSTFRVIYETGHTRAALANLSPEPPGVNVAGIRVEPLEETVHNAVIAKKFLSDSTADIRDDPQYTSVEISTDELPMYFDSLVSTLSMANEETDACDSASRLYGDLPRYQSRSSGQSSVA